MSAKLETLSQNLQQHFGEKLTSLKLALGELTIEVAASDYLELMGRLRDESDLVFEEIVDLCGVDYSTYGEGAWAGKRFAVVSHLLSLANNWRLRVRVFADDDEFPVVASVTSVWTSANWFEREALIFMGSPSPGMRICVEF